MRRLLTSAVVALSFSVLASCGSADTTITVPVTDGTLAGTYTLRTVNGTSLPFVLQAANPMAELVDDTMIVQENGSFTETFSIRLSDGTQTLTQQGTDSGTLVITGNNLAITYNDGTTGSGTVTPGNLNFTVAGFAQVFSKQ